MLKKIIFLLSIIILAYSLLSWKILTFLSILLMTGLSLLFGYSLLPDKTPVITRYALLIDGKLSKEERLYTKIITAVWTILFITLILGKIYSLWILSLEPALTYLTVILIAGVFIGEFTLRKRLFEHHKNRKLLPFINAIIRISWKDILNYSDNKVKSVSKE
jgi:uncharacterized membrane protein